MLKKLFGISTQGQILEVQGKDNAAPEWYIRELEQKNSLLEKYQQLLHAAGFDVEAIDKAIQADGGLDGGIGGMPYKLIALSALRFHRDFSKTSFSEKGISAANQFLDSILRR